MSLGQRIARLRQERNQTLQDVANGAGLTPSFLSRLERDQVNISVANLRKLAQFYDVSMTYFFEGEQRGPAALVVRADDRPRLSSPRAPAQIYALTAPRSRFAARLVELGSAAVAEDESEHFLFVMSGQVRCQIDDEVFELEAGDVLTTQRPAPSRWENLGDRPASLLIVQIGREAS
jgi:transcriptional regulator with XRE-family HTH domain